MDPAILLPLYIYPDPHAWDPLYNAINAHPKLQFLVIINPNSGPGAPPWWPNADYIREIPRLNACPNVQLLGYVRATYCKRETGHVFNDIETFAARGRSGQEVEGLEMQGIFVDETVNLYTKEAKSYLDGIDEMAKGCEGIGGGKMVVHNPGTAVNKGLAEPGPDITVVVETSYEHFVTKEYQEWLATSPYGRDRSCFMVHSVPAEKVKVLTLELREKAKFLFVTSATTNFYESFSPSWQEFIDAMATK